MFTFDVLTLNAFKNEEEKFLSGSIITKIQQATRREFIFVLRNASKSRKLYINIDPQYYHTCFINEETSTKRLLTIPQKPPMFCMLLRKYLSNSKIKKVNIPQNERILEFYINSYNELGERIYLCLAIEFMGKHSNIILYSYDTNMIIGCAHNIGAEKSREREIYGGLPYIYPPKQHKLNISDYNGELNFNTMVNDFYMMSKGFVELCQNKSLEQIKNYVKLQDLSPCISKDYSKYSLYCDLIEDKIKFDSVNNMIDKYYSHHIFINKIKNLKAQYSSIISQKLKKTNKTISQMEYQLQKSIDYDKYRLYGDLLMANMYNLKDYSKTANIYDYENDKKTDIKLDETKTIKDNANSFYKLYNKSKKSQTKIGEMLEDYKATKSYYEQILYSIDIAQNTSDLAQVISEIAELTKANVRTEKQKPQKQELTCIQYDNNTKIYIGKNNKQNDYIISKLSDEEDLWFHVHNMPGSHILLKAQKVTDEMILECAKLAKEYSTAKHSAKAGIIYTKRKYLRKPPKANLGYVTYKNEKEIIV